MYNNDQIDILIAREIEGAITAEERVELEAWVQADDRNRQYYEAMHYTWDLATEADDAPEPDVARNWTKFQQRMEAPVIPMYKENEEKVVPMKRTNWLRMAAAAVVVAAVAGTAFLYLGNTRTTITALADKKEVTLPDGSKVTLNRNSEISYRQGFANTHRELELKGEAYFDVQPDAAHPFVVAAGKSQTRVLGTSFVIKAYAKKTIHLNVVTGKVAFSGKDDEQNALLLTAGKSAIMQENKKPQRVQQGDQNFMAWKNERLEFNAVPLNQTLNTLEEYFNVQFIVDDPAILTKTYTGTFPKPGLEEVLNVIRQAFQVSISEESKGVYRITQL